MQAGEARHLTQLEKEKAGHKTRLPDVGVQKTSAKTLPRETSEPGAPTASCQRRAGALPGM
jgi:hypothetical protein